jgi:Na+/serine symporter
MPRWLRVIRGMIGTGLTFAAGVGVVGSLLGLVGLLLGKLSWDDLRFVAKLSVVSFIVGVAFSGVLAIAARGRTFDRLSLRFVTALGAGGGFLYFLFIASMNGHRVWSTQAAIANLTILTVLGGGSAAAMLILARRAGRALKAGKESRMLGESGMEAPIARRGAEQKSGR